MEIETIDELPPVSRWRSREASEEHKEILAALETGKANSVTVADKTEHEALGQKIRGVARRANLDVRVVFNPENSTTNFELKTPEEDDDN